jgi:hypothetical protein
LKTIIVPLFIKQTIRVLKLDSSVYKEVQSDTGAGWQALIIVVIAALANGIGFGIARGFAWIGGWYTWIILLLLIGSIMLWFTLSLLIYLLASRVFYRHKDELTYCKLLYIIGFSSAPGLFGIFVCIPFLGGFIWIFVVLWTLISAGFALRQYLGDGVSRTLAIYLVSWFLCVIILATFVGLSIGLFVSGEVTQRGSFDNSLKTVTKQQRFSITGWEIAALTDELDEWFHRSIGDINDVETVLKYFKPGERQISLDNAVEQILEDQITEVLREAGITVFPPVKIELGKLPDVLVVSPRDRITKMREVVLVPDLSVQLKEDIETKVDGLDVSSLVVEIAGFGGVYPSYVTNNASLQSTINISIEEWLHQYLAFKPLGFRYLLDLLGISRDYDIEIMNETVAGIFSDELSAALVAKYYPEFQDPALSSSSDFSKEMEAIRQQVDIFLFMGEIEAAEEFMYQKRQDLETQGYYIRKLNQAYFAWHGTYANEPGFVNPIGEELIRLRTTSSSLAEFLEAVERMTNSQDL